MRPRAVAGRRLRFPGRLSDSSPYTDPVKTVYLRGQVSSWCVEVSSLNDRPRDEWLRVGQEIRRLRKAARLSQDQLAQMMTLSPAMLSSIERGIRGCKSEFAEEADAALQTGGRVLRLAEKANAEPGTPAWFLDVVRLQHQATEIRQFQLGWIPGLLQTEKYARLALRAGDSALSESGVQQGVRARLTRQKLLWKESPPLLFVVLEEGVLCRQIGGRGIMAQQLDQLLSAAEYAHITVQVLPLSAGPHAGLDGTFHLLRLPTGERFLALESRVSAEVDDDPDHVNNYTRAFEDLRALALAPKESADMIRKVRGDLQ
ncbi:helix-turn-helix domain-containing protein [Streptomonospora wellingtoniae]|uniref:Helix-turn-helix transcriptional regulator n=1 Tax=Streptomonospora wellingtoniae TaxID=3075544 RepID=A0ABU2KSG9_9ACTN|nr:helix-turn-helix transcriptional regulator [Streptomonospora sp. DSM 45055]MDT0302156.1 helix-turn-helix transcriptional regulator [Streptomonospora sp. DSM 45055]